MTLKSICQIFNHALLIWLQNCILYFPNQWTSTRAGSDPKKSQQTSTHFHLNSKPDRLLRTWFLTHQENNRQFLRMIANTSYIISLLIAMKIMLGWKPIHEASINILCRMFSNKVRMKEKKFSTWLTQLIQEMQQLFSFVMIFLLKKMERDIFLAWF